MTVTASIKILVNNNKGNEQEVEDVLLTEASQVSNSLGPLELLLLSRRS